MTLFSQVLTENLNCLSNGLKSRPQLCLQHLFDQVTECFQLILTQHYYIYLLTRVDFSPTQMLIPEQKLLISCSHYIVYWGHVQFALSNTTYLLNRASISGSIFNPQCSQIFSWLLCTVCDAQAVIKISLWYTALYFDNVVCISYVYFCDMIQEVEIYGKHPPHFDKLKPVYCILSPSVPLHFQSRTYLNYENP